MSPAGAVRSSLAAALTAAAALAGGVADAQPRVVQALSGPDWVLGGWWRQGDGLPQDRVTTLRQTPDGYLWVGTRSGVGRFDGVRFVTWTPGEHGAPPDGEVYSIAEDRSGGLWLSVYGGGVVRYAGRGFSALDATHGLVDNFARAVAVAPDGAVWIGTDRGVSRWAGDQFSHYHSSEGPAGDAIRALHIDQDGGVFAGAERGLFRMAADGFVRVPLPGGTEGAAVEALLRDSRGRLWVATSNGLACLDGHAAGVVVGPSQGVPAKAVRHVYEDSAARLWVATIDGVVCAEPDRTDALRFVPVVSGGDATAVLEDREHSLWVGFRGHGLMRLQRALFSVYGTSRGLPSDSTSTVFQARNGAMWIGAGTGVSVLTGDGVANLGTAEGLPGRSVSSIAEDSAGRIWVGTEAGLYRSRDPVVCGNGRCRARFVAVGGHDALREHIRVLRAQTTSMLVGTNASGVLAVPLTDPGAPVSVVVSGEVRALLRESDDRVWVGTRDHGLALVTPAGVTRYTPAEGLPHITVQSLHRGRDGTLWIGTRMGLAWLREGRMHAVTSASGLHQNHVYGITSDASGRLWLSSGNGIALLSPEELYDVAAGRRPRVAPMVFGAQHGLPSSLCALSHDPVITTASDGRVWVATLGGAVSIDPAHAAPETPRPAVLVESFTVETTDAFPGEAADAQHQRGSLSFRFTAPSYVAPSQTRYRYRLVGFDAAWVDGGSSREARFTNIPPGRYVFEVEAAHGAGSWGTRATATVNLTPRLYQRAWFSALVAIAILAGTAALAMLFQRAHVRRLRARERELAARVDDALAHIKVLRGLLPVCAWCRRVRDDAGYWTQMEAYVRDHSQAEFSHSLCPDCLQTHFPDDAAALQKPADPKPS